jgi:hypothetical protein
LFNQGSCSADYQEKSRKQVSDILKPPILPPKSAF